MISSGFVLIVDARYWSMRCQLSTKRWASMLVKKPAKSWLHSRGRLTVSKSSSLVRSKTSPWARLCGKAAGMFGNAVEHRSERGGEEADNGPSCSELFFALWEDVGVGKITAGSYSPWVRLQKSLLDLVDGEVDGCGRGCRELTKENVEVRKYKHWIALTIDPE